MKTPDSSSSSSSSDYDTDTVEQQQPQPVEITDYTISDTITPNTIIKTTHTTVYVDELESPSQSPIPAPKDYDTQSIAMKFIEEQPEWESMDIQLRIDPSGHQDPVITRKEQTIDTGK